ncbi:MAG: sulfotransferase domain-containing protein [Chromatiales bacterium]|jgi:hypothetical protein|nr:sulfotransferase domain-containing protein [Chromatiales bacterium]
MQRPTSIEEYDALLAKMAEAKTANDPEPLVVRPSDVIISPFGKCGTTWLQQMVHTLRTRGDMDHTDISAVVPWIERSHNLGIDLNAHQRAEPRAFKSHLPYDKVPKGGRYIVSLRAPEDAAVSLFRFTEGWFFEPNTIDINEFTQKDYLGRPSERDYWHHLTSWWEQRDREDVLLLAYEHMVNDAAGTIRKVAAFIDVELDDALLALTLDHTSLPFMLEHKDRFDDRLMRERSETVGGLPPNADSAKVRKGVVGESRHELSDELRRLFQEKWHDRIESTLGFRSYSALIARLP